MYKNKAILQSDTYLDEDPCLSLDKIHGPSFSSIHKTCDDLYVLYQIQAIVPIHKDTSTFLPNDPFRIYLQ